MTIDAKTSFDIFTILKYLPHRYPFLLIDRIIELTPGETIKALKNVTFNEPHFTGHFPERPVMPGVLILEALAQTAGVLVFATLGKVPNANTRFYFAGIDGCRFRRPVVPGDTLTLTAKVDRTVKGIWRLNTVAHVGEAEVASAELMLFPDAENASPLEVV
jgi:3-hydroxyacyl-[acyl-carrier-protein] dehydratase